MRAHTAPLRALVLTTLLASPASAQETTEVIQDPELDGPAASDASTSSGADEETIRDPELDAAGSDSTGTDGAGADTTSADGETISDPELEGPASSGSGSSGTDSFGADLDTFTELRGFLATRVGMDTAWTLPRENVVEATQIGQLEMIHHVSQGVGVGLGVRVRHALGVRKSDPGDGQTPTTLDVTPVAAYGDFALGNVTHLRLGYQIIQLGRFDMFSATNLLGVYDLRSGPATMAGASHVAQPAVSLNVDPTEHWSFTGIYIPFFTPHLIDLTGTDYAGFSQADRDFRAQIEPQLEAARQNPTDPNNRELLAFADAADYLGAVLNRSNLGSLGAGAFSAFTPTPNFTKGQGAVRATLHGSAGELAVTGITALERFGVLHYSSQFLAYDPNTTTAANFYDAFGPNPVTLQYNRFYVAAVDGATDLGPMQVGAELSYQFRRTLTSVPTAPADPNVTPTTVADLVAPLPAEERSDVAQVALRAELLQGEDLAVVVEGLGLLALENASPGRRYLLLDGGNRYYGAAGGLRWSPSFVDGLRLELGGAALYGPTFVALPRAEYELVPDLFVELGAVIVEGRKTSVTSPNVSLGTLFDATDQIFTGLRWVL